MNTTIFVRGTTRDELKQEVRNSAKRMLGRLQRHVSHAEFLFEEQDEDTGQNAYQCTLRLHLSEGGGVLVHARSGGRDAALTGALRQARRALLRRRRTALRLSSWHKRLQPALV
jgi:hypothetical protein